MSGLTDFQVEISIKQFSILILDLRGEVWAKNKHEKLEESIKINDI